MYHNHPTWNYGNNSPRQIFRNNQNYGEWRPLPNFTDWYNSMSPPRYQNPQWNYRPPPPRRLSQYQTQEYRPRITTPAPVTPRLSPQTNCQPEFQPPINSPQINPVEVDNPVINTVDAIDGPSIHIMLAKNISGLEDKINRLKDQIPISTEEGQNLEEWFITLFNISVEIADVECTQKLVDLRETFNSLKSPDVGLYLYPMDLAKTALMNYLKDVQNYNAKRALELMEFLFEAGEQDRNCEHHRKIFYELVTNYPDLSVRTTTVILWTAAMFYHKTLWDNKPPCDNLKKRNEEQETVSGSVIGLFEIFLKKQPPPRVEECISLQQHFLNRSEYHLNLSRMDGMFRKKFPKVDWSQTLKHQACESFKDFYVQATGKRKTNVPILPGFIIREDVDNLSEFKDLVIKLVGEGNQDRISTFGSILIVIKEGEYNRNVNRRIFLKTLFETVEKLNVKHDKATKDKCTLWICIRILQTYRRLIKSDSGTIDLLKKNLMKYFIIPDKSSYNELTEWISIRLHFKPLIVLLTDVRLQMTEILSKMCPDWRRLSKEDRKNFTLDFDHFYKPQKQKEISYLELKLTQLEEANQSMKKFKTAVKELHPNSETTFSKGFKRMALRKIIMSFQRAYENNKDLSEFIHILLETKWVKEATEQRLIILWSLSLILKHAKGKQTKASTTGLVSEAYLSKLLDWFKFFKDHVNSKDTALIMELIAIRSNLSCGILDADFHSIDSLMLYKFPTLKWKDKVNENKKTFEDFYPMDSYICSTPVETQKELEQSGTSQSSLEHPRTSKSNLEHPGTSKSKIKHLGPSETTFVENLYIFNGLIKELVEGLNQERISTFRRITTILVKESENKSYLKGTVFLKKLFKNIEYLQAKHERPTSATRYNKCTLWICIKIMETYSYLDSEGLGLLNTNLQKYFRPDESSLLEWISIRLHFKGLMIDKIEQLSDIESQMNQRLSRICPFIDWNLVGEGDQKKFTLDFEHFYKPLPVQVQFAFYLELELDQIKEAFKNLKDFETGVRELGEVSEKAFSSGFKQKQEIIVKKMFVAFKKAYKYFKRIDEFTRILFNTKWATLQNASTEQRLATFVLVLWSLSFILKYVKGIQNQTNIHLLKVIHLAKLQYFTYFKNHANPKDTQLMEELIAVRCNLSCGDPDSDFHAIDSLMENAFPMINWKENVNKNKKTFNDFYPSVDSYIFPTPEDVEEVLPHESSPPPLNDTFGGELTPVMDISQNLHHHMQENNDVIPATSFQRDISGIRSANLLHPPTLQVPEDVEINPANTLYESHTLQVIEEMDTSAQEQSITDHVYTETETEPHSNPNLTVIQNPEEICDESEPQTLPNEKEVINKELVELLAKLDRNVGEGPLYPLELFINSSKSASWNALSITMGFIDNQHKSKKKTSRPKRPEFDELPDYSASPLPLYPIEVQLPVKDILTNGDIWEAMLPHIPGAFHSCYLKPVGVEDANCERQFCFVYHEDVIVQYLNRISGS